MNKKLAIIILLLVNVIIAAFCSFAYFSFTGNMVVRTEVVQVSSPVPMARGGLEGSIYRYVFCAVAALLLQGVMAIFEPPPFLWTER